MIEHEGFYHEGMRGVRVESFKICCIDMCRYPSWQRLLIVWYTYLVKYGQVVIMGVISFLKM